MCYAVQFLKHTSVQRPLDVVQIDVVAINTHNSHGALLNFHILDSLVDPAHHSSRQTYQVSRVI